MFFSSAAVHPSSRCTSSFFFGPQTPFLLSGPLTLLLPPSHPTLCCSYISLVQEQVASTSSSASSSRPSDYVVDDGIRGNVDGTGNGVSGGGGAGCFHNHARNASPLPHVVYCALTPQGDEDCFRDCSVNGNGSPVANFEGGFSACPGSPVFLEEQDEQDEQEQRPIRREWTRARRPAAAGNTASFNRCRSSSVLDVWGVL